MQNKHCVGHQYTSSLFRYMFTKANLSFHSSQPKMHVYFVSARTPKLCALYFPGEETTGIAPVSNVTDGQLIEGESVRCEWDGETVTATIVKLSGNIICLFS